ncbi:MAG: DUF4383 domain-containing protein [Leptolyngbyaceae cyanobacterium bins.302]|nr:DUF4383 domain-containing protein [Leptolyngbyaceae cyanobacterium bins.302]
MKPAQYFALIAGIFFLILGILGFLPGVVEKVNGQTLDSVGAYDNGFGYILGVIPTNAFHSIIRLAFGISGILASISLDSTRVYSRAIAIGYGLFAVMGLFPYTNTTFGLAPIYGSDVLLHAASAAIGFYFGFIAQPGLLELGSNNPQQNVQ